jgi:cytochrome c551/c552
LKLGDSMKALLLSVAAGSLMLAGQASADDAAKALAQKSGCLACHSVDAKVVGPAYKDVAAKYKGKIWKQSLLKKLSMAVAVFGVQFQCQQTAHKLKMKISKLSFIGCCHFNLNHRLIRIKKPVQKTGFFLNLNGIFIAHLVCCV